MQSIDSIETYTYGMRKYLVSIIGEIICNNIVKRYKRWLALLMLQKKI